MLEFSQVLLRYLRIPAGTFSKRTEARLLGLPVADDVRGARRCLPLRPSNQTGEAEKGPKKGAEHCEKDPECGARSRPIKWKGGTPGQQPEPERRPSPRMR